MKKLSCILLLFFQSNSALAQQLSRAVAGLSEERFLCLRYDNDLFNYTDRYYTQGVKLDIVHQAFKRSPISCGLFLLKKSDFNYYGFHFTHNVFTPKSILYNNGQVYPGERPYTATFFLSQSLTSVNSDKNMLVFSAIDVGLLGPLAKGKEVQTGIHKATNNALPLGWNNQLNNALVLNYNIGIEKGLIIKKHLAFSSFASARLGTLYTDALLGLKWRAGLFDCWFKKALARGFNISLIAEAQTRFVAYNATLQGGLSTKNNVYTLGANKIRRQVYQSGAGLVLVYKRFGLEYTQTFISPEFEGGAPHGWGSCAFCLRF